MWPSLRRAARSKNFSHVFRVSFGSMDSKLTGGGVRDTGCQVLSQLLLLGYPESLFPIIRRFSGDSTEWLSNSKSSDELSGQDAADQLDENFDCSDEPSHGNVTINASKKLNEAKASISGSWNSNMDHSADVKSQHRSHRPYLFHAVLDAPLHSVRSRLEKWIGDGNQLERSEFLLVLFHLQKQQSYRKALQFVEWTESTNLVKFEEGDYACHLDLIARNSSLENAQQYISRVPKPFRNEVLYETLLVNCVRVSDIQKAEEVFREIRDLSLPLTVSACNQMILLYKRIARTKVVDILMLMVKENIKHSPFTYKLIIDLKGLSNDMSGVELVLNEMKASGFEPDFATQTMVARFFINGGLVEKAEAIIHKMEMKYIKDKRHAIRSLLHLYAALGKPSEVARIWKLCTEPKLEHFMAAIVAWGKLGCIEQAEEIFHKLKVIRYPGRKLPYAVLLEAYVNAKVYPHGFTERMRDDGVHLVKKVIEHLKFLEKLPKGGVPELKG